MDVIARGIAGWWIDHGMDHSILTIRLFKHVQTTDIHVSGRDIQGMRLCTLGSVQKLLISFNSVGFNVRMTVLSGNSTSKNRAFIYSRWWKSRNQTCSSATLTGAVVDCPYGNLSRITKPVKSARRFFTPWRPKQGKRAKCRALPIRNSTLDRMDFPKSRKNIIQNAQYHAKWPNKFDSRSLEKWSPLVSQISLSCGRRNSMPQRTPMRCKL